MIKPGILVYFRNALGEVLTDTIGFVTRQEPTVVRGVKKDYYVHWTGDTLAKGWYEESYLVEVLKDNDSEG